MRRRIYVLFTSLIILFSSLSAAEEDSTRTTRALIIGFDIVGPVMYTIDDNLSNFEGYFSYRLTDKHYAVVDVGYANYSYSQYNYDYNCSGSFLRLGIDINLIKPKEGIIKHFAGFGFRYGISLSNQETPFYSYENYWGSIESSIEPQFFHSHYLEAGGGVRAEIFKNIFVGWSVKLRLLIYSSAGEDNYPSYIPGVGPTGKAIRPSINYYVAWQLPFRFNK